jgi:predicted transposase YdaD
VERIEAEAGEQAPILLTAAFVLMGLRLSRERAVEMFQGVRKMRESTTYQAILDEGRAEGLAKGRAEGLSEGEAEGMRKLLLLLGRKHLGEPDAAVESAVRSINDRQRLTSLAERVTEVKNWRDLLATP